VLSALPKSAHPGAKKALAEIWNAEDREHARRAVAAFKLAYGAKFGKAVAKITEDLDELLALYDFPAEHWVHLRTTNPIESTFATVRHRTKVTKGPGSKAAGLAMAFKLTEAAQARWRAVNAPHLVAFVRAGATSNAANSSNAPRLPRPPRPAAQPNQDHLSTSLDIARRGGDVGDPVKDASLEVPIPEAWRPTLEAVVDSLVRRDTVIGAGLPSVDPVPLEISQRCLQAVDDYGAGTLISLPDESWDTSVALWFGDRCRCLIHLWTEEKGRSDLVLDIDVFDSCFADFLDLVDDRCDTPVAGCGSPD
jgi:Transposase, Mutator family